MGGQKAFLRLLLVIWRGDDGEKKWKTETYCLFLNEDRCNYLKSSPECNNTESYIIICQLEMISMITTALWIDSSYSSNPSKIDLSTVG